MSAPQLRILVNQDTGEVVEQDERDVLIDQLQADLKGKALQIGKLKRELKELRATEPNAQVVRDILLYCNERWGKRYEIAPGGKYWAKVRERLKDKLDGRDPWTPAELKLAADGALLDDWISGRDRDSKGYLKPDTVFRDPEKVRELRDLALGFDASAGVSLGDLLDVAPELRWINWRFLVAICTCGHRRIEHHPGFETCAVPSCDCLGYSLDVFDETNLKLDPDLKRVMQQDTPS